MSKLFKENWKRSDSFDLSKTFKKADQIRIGDILVSGRMRDIVQAVDRSGQFVKIEGRNFKYELNPSDNVRVFDISKSTLSKSDRQLIDKELFKASLSKEDADPWAICTASVGRESAKFEDCVMEIKQKLGKSEAMTPDEADQIATANVDATGIAEKDIDGTDFEEELIDIAYDGDRAEQNNKMKSRIQKWRDLKSLSRQEIEEEIKDVKTSIRSSSRLWGADPQWAKERGDYSVIRGIKQDKERLAELTQRLTRMTKSQTEEKDMGIENAGKVPNSLLAAQDLEGTDGSTTQEQDKKDV